MRIIRWICAVKLTEKLFCIELRRRLRIEDIYSKSGTKKYISEVHVLRKDDDDLVNRCVTFEVEAARQRSRSRQFQVLFCCSVRFCPTFVCHFVSSTVCWQDCSKSCD